jgi:hypothetical protein
VRADVKLDSSVSALVAGWNDAEFEPLREQPVADNVVSSSASVGHAPLMAAAAGDNATWAAIETAFGLLDGAHDACNAFDHQIAARQSDRIDRLASRHGADVVPLDLAANIEGSTTR